MSLCKIIKQAGRFKLIYPSLLAGIVEKGQILPH